MKKSTTNSHGCLLDFDYTSNFTLILVTVLLSDSWFAASKKLAYNTCHKNNKIENNKKKEDIETLSEKI